MDASLLANLLAYSAQIACLAAVGSLLPLLLRIDAADVRHAYWRALLALCVILPWMQGRHEPAPDAPAAAADGVAPPIVSTIVEGVAGVAPAADWVAPLAGGLLAAGVVVRLVWLGAGLLHLGRLRASGRVAARC